MFSKTKEQRFIIPGTIKSYSDIFDRVRMPTQVQRKYHFISYQRRSVRPLRDPKATYVSIKTDTHYTCD